MLLNLQGSQMDVSLGFGALDVCGVVALRSCQMEGRKLDCDIERLNCGLNLFAHPTGELDAAAAWMEAESTDLLGGHASAHFRSAYDDEIRASRIGLHIYKGAKLCRPFGGDGFTGIEPQDPIAGRMA